MFVQITGTGSYLPERVVTNDELAATLDTSDEWIYSHTGIRSRHIGADDESTSSMAVNAARAALASADVEPEDLGLIIVATSTSDYQAFPSTACLVQHELGAMNAACFDLQAACTGFIYALIGLDLGSKSGHLSADGDTVTFTPHKRLSGDMWHWVFLSVDVKDDDGNRLKDRGYWVFKTVR